MMYLNHDEQDLINRKAIDTAMEIQNQPKIWRKMAAMLASRQEELSAWMDEVLSIPGIRVIFTGAGSSAFIGESMMLMLAQERRLQYESVHSTEAVATPELMFEDVPTLLVSYARSGDSPESCAAIEAAAREVKELYNLVICCNKNSSLATMELDPKMSKVINIPQEACDQGFAMTCSVSCMSLATWILFSGKDMSNRIAYIEDLACDIEKQMPAYQAKAAEAAAFQYERIIYLGFGALRGLSREGAVKSQELTNGAVVALYDTPTGFRHGPKTVINEKALVVLMASPLKRASLYDKDMLHELCKDGAAKVAVVAGPAADYSLEEAHFAYRYEEPAAYAGSQMSAYIHSLMFLQILSFEKSYDMNMTTDNPCPGGEVNRVVQGVTVH